MNVGDVKSVVADKAPLEQAQKDKMNAVNVQQGRSLLQESAVHVSLSSGEAKTLASARILQATLGQNVTVNNQRLLESLPKQNEEKNLFDFEEVAKNVLQFIGGALKTAQANGADDEELLQMFEKARDGVLKGVEDARKELAGLMNKEIDEGISNSLKAIREGIDQLERDILGKKDEGEESVTAVSASQSVTASSENAGEINIVTKDGDEVTISFEDFQEVSASREVAIETTSTDPVNPGTTSTGAAEEAETEENQPQLASSETSVNLSQQYSVIDSQELAFTVKGEIDEQERKAIENLVRDTSALVDDFFAGDVEAAFAKALELGFDEGQIAEYSIELSKTETIEVVQTYEQVSSYADSDSPSFPSPFKKIADYVDDLAKVMGEAKDELADNASFDNLVNGLINRVIDINTDDLLAAINRFNSFNQRFDADRPFPEQGQQTN